MTKYRQKFLNNIKDYFSKKYINYSENVQLVAKFLCENKHLKE